MNPNPEEHKRLVNAGLQKLRVVREVGQRVTDPSQQVLLRLAMVSETVLKQVVPVVQAARTSGQPTNHQALGQLISKGYLDQLRTWSKDDLLFLVVVMSTHGMVEKITSE